MKIKRLVVDTSNLFWRAVAAQKRYGPSDASESAGLGLHMSLLSLRKHFNNIKPQKLAICFEGKKNWRKEYTRSAECISQRLYKGNRVADPNMASLFEVLTAFEQLAREHTNIVTLTHPELEGDDLISGYAKHYAELGDEVIILSGDKDFVSLLGNPNITLLNPDTGKNRTVLEVCGVDDAAYFMFEKCFRGDSGDNVLPAFPRVRSTRLHKAYGVKDGKVHPELADAFEMSNLFNSTWEFVHPETGEKRIMSVEQMFKENMTLMDLTSQPENIKKIIAEVIQHESENHGSFNFFKFQQFLGKYKLKEIAERSTDFVSMFSGKAFPLNTSENNKKPLVLNEAPINGLQF
jgi:5'-3' exonuclease, N-terminal resolvase-like domain